MKISLGVHDVAYADPEINGATTTGAVASILEAKYKVMRVFVGLNKPEIRRIAINHMRGMIESLAAGKPESAQRNTPLPKIESAFRDYLSADEWQHTTGKTIKAAQLGVSHRFKNDVYNRRSGRPARPAFIDTGLYSRSFRAWISK